MSNLRTSITTPTALKSLKTGDRFHVQSDSGTRLRFKVSGADIVHRRCSKPASDKNAVNPMTLTIATAYPFGRLRGDTPLRYVVYAEPE